MADWSLPGDDGLSDCPAHPEAGRFAPSDGCHVCISAPPQTERRVGPNERLQLEAIARGLPDGLGWESRTAGTWESAKAEEKTCRSLRALCTKRGKAILREDIELAPTVDGKGNAFPVDQDREAREWFKLAASFTAHVLKAQDVQVKAGKLTAMPAALRDSDAFIEKQNAQGIAGAVNRGKGQGN